MFLFSMRHIGDKYHALRDRIYGFRLIAAAHHRKYGIATDARHIINGHSILRVNIFIICVKVMETTIRNIYKPSQSKWPLPAISVTQQVHTGKFNSYHMSRGNSTDDVTGEQLAA